MLKLILARYDSDLPSSSWIDEMVASIVDFASLVDVICALTSSAADSFSRILRSVPSDRYLAIQLVSLGSVLGFMSQDSRLALLMFPFNLTQTGLVYTNIE